MAGEILDNRGRGEVSWNFPSIHPEGRKFGVIAIALSLIPLFFGWDIIGYPMLALSAGVFAFFRDPERVVPQGDNAIVAPADGLVSMIAQFEPPEELRVDDGSGVDGLPSGPVTRISIFMSVFDVHINRAPIAGIVRRVIYIPGKFMNADLDKASEENERQHFLIERSDGTKIGFTQIAGLVARRIIPFVKSGDMVASGQRVGLIRFPWQSEFQPGSFSIHFPTSVRKSDYLAREGGKKCKAQNSHWGVRVKSDMCFQWP